MKALIVAGGQGNAPLKRSRLSVRALLARPRSPAPPGKKGDPMALLAAYAVPHPPLIVPAVGRGQETAIADTIAAYREVARRVAAHRPDLIVITSPHAPPLPRRVLHRRHAGGNWLDGRLRAAGRAHDDPHRPSLRQDVATRLHRRGIPSAGAPASMADIDHATFVPLHFLEETVDLGSVAVVRMGLGLSRPITASWAGPLPRPPAP